MPDTNHSLGFIGFPVNVHFGLRRQAFPGCVVKSPTCSIAVLFPGLSDAPHASGDRLGGLVVKAFASRAEDPEFESRLRRDFSGSSHTSDLKIGTPVATLPSAWRDRVSAGTGRPGVSIL